MKSTLLEFALILAAMSTMVGLLAWALTWQ